jgi:hypothetical protein
MRAWYRILREIFVSAVIVLVLLEIALRLFPGVIPVFVLAEFSDDLRSSIALKRGLTLARDTVALDRNDGGAPILLRAPDSLVHYPFDDPGTVRDITMDHWGFCNPAEQPYGRAHIDVVAIGDSFTWCFAVDPRDTWVSKLGEETNHSVYNLGLFGQGLYEELQIFRRFGIEKSPKVVILNVYEGNDFFDALNFKNYRETVTKAGSTAPFETSCVLPRGLCQVYRATKEGWPGRRSYAFNLIANGARLGFDALAHAKRVKEGNARSTFVEFEVTVAGESFQFRDTTPTTDYIIAHGSDSAAGTLPFQEMNEALREFVALGKQYGFHPLVVYSPMPATAYVERAIFTDTRDAEIMRSFSQSQRSFFVEASRVLGFSYLDLTPSLVQAAAGDELLFYPSNQHYTAAGHRVVAATIAASQVFQSFFEEP